MLCGSWWKLKLEHRPTVLSLSCIQTEPKHRLHHSPCLHHSFHHSFTVSLILAETTAPLQLEVLSSMGISWKSWKKHFTTVTSIKSCPFLPFFAYLLLTSQIHGCKGIAQRLTCLASNNWRGIQREYDCQVGHRDTGDNKKSSLHTDLESSCTTSYKQPKPQAGPWNSWVSKPSSHTLGASPVSPSQAVEAAISSTAGLSRTEWEHNRQGMNFQGCLSRYSLMQLKSAIPSLVF